MSWLPDTRSETRRKTTASWYQWYAAVAAVLVLCAAAVFVLGGDKDPEPREAVYGGVEDIAAGTEDVPFPRTDASRFDTGTRAVRVYLRVEGVPVGQGMVATVERSGRTSLFAAVFGGPDVRADNAGGGQLSVSEEGASGVVPFVVRAADGGALPAGGYTVEVRFGPGGGEEEGRVAARKYFTVGDPQD